MTERRERIEHADVGFSLTIKSKRGTGTRDQDEVTLEVAGGNRNDISNAAQLACDEVARTMNLRRKHQPGEDEEDE